MRGLSLLPLLLVGCQHMAVDEADKPDIAPLHWVPEAMYLPLTPLRSLRLEVDAVDGCLPDERHLKALRDFVDANCIKPGGIELVIDDIIPREEVAGCHARPIMFEHMGGPMTRDTAFMHLFYFDSRLTAEEGQNPYATRKPHPAAMITDRHFDMWGQFGKHANAILAHKSGHLLGLSENPAHSHRRRCVNDDCAMNVTISFRLSRILLWRDPEHQRELCDDCLADIAKGRVKPSENISFLGLDMLRQEGSYLVASLTGYVNVHAGDRTNLDFADLVDYAQRRLPSPALTTVT